VARDGGQTNCTVPSGVAAFAVELGELVEIVPKQLTDKEQVLLVVEIVVQLQYAILIRWSAGCYNSQQRSTFNGQRSDFVLSPQIRFSGASVAATTGARILKKI